jgi:hypothetical protein
MNKIDPRHWKRQVDAVLALPRGSEERAAAERTFAIMCQQVVHQGRREFRVDYLRRAAHDDTHEDREQRDDA